MKDIDTSRYTITESGNVIRGIRRGRRMTVKELKKVIETLPDDFEIVISTDIGGNRPFNFRELEDISVDIGYSSKVVHFFGILER